MTGLYRPLAEAILYLSEKHSRPGLVVTTIPKYQQGIVVLLVSHTIFLSLVVGPDRFMLPARSHDSGT